MRSTIIRAAAPIAAVAVLLVGAAGAASARHASSANQKIKARVGAYMLAFTPKSGTIAVSHGGSAVLQIRELGGNAKVNLLKSTKRITHSGTNWTLSGNAPWASFQLTLTASSPTSDGQPSGSALIGLTLKVTPRKDAPTDPGPDVTLVHAPAAALKEYAAAPPVAGNNLFLSNTQLGSTILYFSNYTALGPYFDRTRSGVTQPNFPYLRAGTKGSLVGVSRGSFGYVPPPSSLGSLPHKKTTVVVSSYLYLEPAIPSAESDIATAYLRALDTVNSAVAQPSVPAADWQTLAARSAARHRRSIELGDRQRASVPALIRLGHSLRPRVADPGGRAGRNQGLRSPIPHVRTLRRHARCRSIHVLRPGIRHRHEQPSPRSVGTGRELVFRQ